jgi:putative membrane protein
MIERYSDHAANERTFLAWIRTGIALAAFGFVLEKFHFFLVRIESLGIEQSKHSGMHDTQIAGIILVVFGLLVIVGSIARYIRTDARIRSPDPVIYSTRAATLLGLMLLVLGCFMLWTMIGL